MSPILYAAVASLALAIIGVYIGAMHCLLTEARYEASHDTLTGLDNRRPLPHTIATAIAAGRPFAIVMVDIDWFKDINDRYGHHAGDTVLIDVAHRITATDGVTRVFRLGGDEFLALVPGDQEHVTAVAKAIWIAMASDDVPLPDGHRAGIQVSIGVATHRIGINSAELLRQADTALAQAKQIHSVVQWRPGARIPSTVGRPRRRQRDQHLPAESHGGGRSWRCWFDAMDMLPLAYHAAAARHHQRTDGEHDLIQDCPGGLAIVADGGHITAHSTGWPAPLREAHDPGTVLYATAVDTETPPATPGPHTETVAHIHLNAEAVEAIHRAANWGGLLEITVTAEQATFTLTRPTGAIS